MTSTTIIGIDNATSGALAVLAFNRPPQIIPFVTLPKVPKQSTELDDVWFHETMQSLTALHGPVRVIAERAQKFSVGILALCSTWACWGAIRMCLRAQKIPFVPIDPRTWQAEMLRGIAGANTKEKSIAQAKRLFPEANLRRSVRCTTDDDGMADALLIAEYGRRHNL